MYEFKLPDLGEGIAEAEILEWHVDIGGFVEEDAPLVDVETDKATVTIPSPVAGKVAERAGEVGDTVHVGQILVVIETDGDETDGDETVALDSAVEKAKPETAHAAKGLDRNGGEGADESVPAPPAPNVVRGPVPAAPATRRIARELGVDIAKVPGSGPAGRVTSEDVTRFAEAVSGQSDRASGGRSPREDTGPRPGPSAVDDIRSSSTQDMQAPVSAGLPYVQLESMPKFEQWGPVERVAFRSIRRKVARKMATVSVIVPQVTHTDEADITLLEQVRRRINERLAEGGLPKVTVTAMVVRALPSLLRRYPMFNASLDWERDELVFKHYYNIGVAADSPKGLVVPVVRDAGSLSIRKLAKTIFDLGTRAREDKLEARDFQGGTFTVSNIGALGGFSPNPIVNYPEVALLGMGRAKDRPVVRDGQVVVRRMLPLALSFDHRVADGADAARLLSELVAWLEDPELFLASV